ncbi:hypothetical protein [Streptomyces mirabilis]|uniref:hypothetical protein n=1 Tax=Streptomyces mirabilis TaxID=68239 RepID=UPI00369A6EB4
MSRTPNSDRILRHAVKLRSAVKDLAHGGNIISQWCHGLDEPHELPPTDWIKCYPETVDTWVFGSLCALLPVEQPEPDSGSQTPAR